MHKALEEMIGRWFLYILKNDAADSVTKLAKLLETDYNDAYRMKVRFQEKTGSSRKAVELLLGYHIRTGRSIDEVFRACTNEDAPLCAFEGFIDSVSEQINEFVEAKAEESQMVGGALGPVMQALEELRKIFCLRYKRHRVECSVCPYITNDYDCPCKMLATFLEWLRAFLLSCAADAYSDYGKP